MSERVELHQAFFWACDECGRDNFERAVELSPDEVDARGISRDAERLSYTQREALDEIGLDPGGVWLVAPTRVACKGCGAEFEAGEHGEDSL